MYIRGSNSSNKTQENNMEILLYENETLSLEGVPLEMDEMFLLCFAEVMSKGKNYIADVYIEFKKDIIANNYLEVIEFFSFIEAFTKKGLVVGHENSFFKVCQKDKISYLKCKFVKDEYFLSAPKLKTMLNMYGEFRAGNSLKHLANSKIILEDYNFRGIVSSYYLNEENIKQEMTQYLKDNVENYQNYTIFDKITLGCYDLIKYRDRKKLAIKEKKPFFFPAPSRVCKD